MDIVHAGDGDFCPDEFEGDFLLLVRPAESDADHAAWLSAEEFDDIVGSPSTHVRAIDGDDLVIGENTRACGGRSVDGIYDGDPAIFHGDLESDSAEGVGREMAGELLGGGGWHVLGVGIEFSGESDDGVFEQSVWGDGLLVHVILAEELHHVDEEIELVQHLCGVAGLCLLAVGAIAPDGVAEEQRAQKAEEGGPEFHTRENYGLWRRALDPAPGMSRLFQALMRPRR